MLHTGLNRGTKLRIPFPLQGGTVATVNNYNAATNKTNGAQYDAAGNLILYTGNAFTHDADNRITSATQSGIGSMYYSYDGTEQRVQEISTYNTEKSQSTLK